jgi:hypothetical protein
MHNKTLAMKIIFPNSQLYIKNNPTLEFLSHDDQRMLIENKNVTNKEISQILDENRDDRNLDLFDIWMFTATIKNRLSSYISSLEHDAMNIDPPHNIAAHINEVKKYLSADYYI